MTSPLKTYRLENRISQKELAEKLGVSSQLVSHIENGRRPITPQNANDWAPLLQVPRETLCPLFGEVPA